MFHNALQIKKEDKISPFVTDGFYTIGYINWKPAMWADYDEYIECKDGMVFDKRIKSEAGEMIPDKKFIVVNKVWELYKPAL